MKTLLNNGVIEESLTPENCLLFAMHHYDNPGCHDIKEFEDDYARFKYLKRLLRWYNADNNIDKSVLRLMVNHIIILANVFGISNTVRLLFVKMEKDLWGPLKTLLVFLNYMPDVIPGIHNIDINGVDIFLDLPLANLLRDLYFLNPHYS